MYCQGIQYLVAPSFKWAPNHGWCLYDETKSQILPVSAESTKRQIDPSTGLRSVGWSFIEQPICEEYLVSGPLKH